MTTYPGNINDCYKIPSKGGIPIEDLKQLAERMRINTKGLLKRQICDAIILKLTQRNDDDDNVDIDIIRQERRKAKPVKKEEEKAPPKPSVSETKTKIRIKEIIPLKMPPPPPPAWYINGKRPILPNNVMQYAMGSQHYDWVYYILGTAMLFGKTPAHNLLKEYTMNGVIPESIATNIRKDISNIE